MKSMNDFIKIKKTELDIFIIIIMNQFKMYTSYYK